jgi:hypothetical protein
MRLPPLKGAPDSALVNAVAAVSPEWQHGSVCVNAAERIGAVHGLSGGLVYRVEADSEHGSLSFVVKQDAAQLVERAMRFHRGAGRQLRGTIPVLFGRAVEEATNTGVLLLEHIAPAAQGDVLNGCSDTEAVAAVRSLARVHAIAWNSTGADLDGVPQWTARSLPPDAWAERLAASAARFPEAVTASLFDRLSTIPERAARAIKSLAASQVAWIHGDAHLDNVLFRPDGTTVLLDWSGAVAGPPAIDVVRLLTEGVNTGARSGLATQLVIGYTEELASHGVSVDTGELWAGMSDALALLVQSAIGWAAREEDREPLARMRALQQSLLGSVLAWAANEQMTQRGRVFEP